MPVISGVGRLRQEGHHEFKASLGYTVSSRSTWALVKACLKTKGNNTYFMTNPFTPKCLAENEKYFDTKTPTRILRVALLVPDGSEFSRRNGYLSASVSVIKGE